MSSGAKRNAILELQCWGLSCTCWATHSLPAGAFPKKIGGGDDGSRIAGSCLLRLAPLFSSKNWAVNRAGRTRPALAVQDAAT